MITKKKIQSIISDHKDKASDFESELVSEIRQFAPGKYFLPFLEEFIEETLKLERILNSKYVLTMILKDENKLFQRDTIGFSGTSYSYSKDEIIILDKRKDIYIVKGILTDMIENLNLATTLDYIKKNVLAKYQDGVADGHVIYLFDLLNKQKILELLENDFKENEKKLFIRKANN